MHVALLPFASISLIMSDYRLLHVNMAQSPAQGIASLPNHSSGPATWPVLPARLGLSCQILAGLRNQYR
jgi:hypothetical protein